MKIKDESVEKERVVGFKHPVTSRTRDIELNGLDEKSLIALARSVLAGKWDSNFIIPVSLG